MNKNDLKFVPKNNIMSNDLIIFDEHNKLIRQNKYSEATSLLNNNPKINGFRAPLFNFMEEKIRHIQTILLTKTTENLDYYSEDEPTDEEMNGKKFWLKPF